MPIFKEIMDAAKFEHESNLEQEKKFCPLIHTFCNKKCVCFESSSIEEQLVGDEKTPEKKYFVWEAHCSNAMFFGTGE